MSEDILRHKKVCDICGADKTKVVMRTNGPYHRWYGRRLGATICNNCYSTLKRHHKKDQAKQIKCACGCGELISSIDTKLRPQRFKWGHHMVGKQGPIHPSWGGGRKIRNGYIGLYSPNHHFADKKHYVFEHRLIWEKYNNAILLPWADVHHINGNKIDNRIENLKALTHSEHKRLHALGLLPS